MSKRTTHTLATLLLVELPFDYRAAKQLLFDNKHKYSTYDGGDLGPMVSIMFSDKSSLDIPEPEFVCCTTDDNFVNEYMAKLPKDTFADWE